MRAELRLPDMATDKRADDRRDRLSKIKGPILPWPKDAPRFADVEPAMLVRPHDGGAGALRLGWQWRRD